MGLKGITPVVTDLASKEKKRLGLGGGIELLICGVMEEKIN